MLVVAAAFTSVHEAHLARSVLEAAGIEARIADEHTVSVNWVYSNAVITQLACVLSIVGLLCVRGAGAAQSAPPGATPRVDALPPTIPIFPLQDVVLFPSTDRTLYIFEPRYRSMVADAWKGDRIIGMVLLQPGTKQTTKEGLRCTRSAARES